MRNFREMLTARQKKVNSILCVGLDPLVEKLPASIREAIPHVPDWMCVFFWMKGVVDAVAPYTSLFKLQHAHYEAIQDGLQALKLLIAHIRLQYPDIPIFVDCKRGDIDRTQGQYREAHFTQEGADAINYNGYMGKDTLKSLVNLDHPGRSLVGLGRTSNPDAWEIQDELMENDEAVWEFMVKWLFAWSEQFGVLENAGVVMGAAHKDPTDAAKIYSRHLSRAREIVGQKMWFLIPGVGAQGGLIKETIEACFTGAGSIAISSSSAIIFASSPAEAAKKACEEMRAAGGNCN